MYNTSSKVKRIVIIVAICLAAALVIGLLIVGIRALTRHPNEDNIIYQIYDSDSSYTDKAGKGDAGIEWKIKKDGSIVADGEATANTSFEIGTVTLPAGTYTFTANDDTDRNEYYVVGTVGGVEVWYSDRVNSEFGRTHTFGSDTAVTFKIVVLEGTEMNNVKFLPCVVEGKVSGEYYD